MTFTCAHNLEVSISNVIRVARMPVSAFVSAERKTDTWCWETILLGHLWQPSAAMNFYLVFPIAWKANVWWTHKIKERLSTFLPCDYFMRRMLPHHTLEVRKTVDWRCYSILDSWHWVPYFSIFFFFMGPTIKIKTVHHLKIPQKAESSNISRWFNLDSKIFVKKKSKPLDHKIWKFWGPILQNPNCSIYLEDKKWLWAQNWMPNHLGSRDNGKRIIDLPRC